MKFAWAFALVACFHSLTSAAWSASKFRVGVELPRLGTPINAHLKAELDHNPGPLTRILWGGFTFSKFRMPEGRQPLYRRTRPVNLTVVTRDGEAVQRGLEMVTTSHVGPARGGEQRNLVLVTRELLVPTSRGWEPIGNTIAATHSATTDDPTKVKPIVTHSPIRVPESADRPFPLIVSLARIHGARTRYFLDVSWHGRQRVITDMHGQPVTPKAAYGTLAVSHLGFTKKDSSSRREELRQERAAAVIKWLTREKRPPP